MNVEIINIGDELLIGQVVNTNASWIAEQLNLAGFPVKKITSIADNETEIAKSIGHAFKESSIILMTGGLGPTKDDITKTTLVGYFNTTLKLDNKAKEMISGFFLKRGLELSETNYQQALVPEDCTVIYNYNGTASGMWFERDGKVLVSLPGVPFEMKAMVSDQVIPMLQKKFSSKTIIHRTILTTGIGESFLADIISQWEDELPYFIKLAYLPSPGMVRLRLSAFSDSDSNSIIEEEIDKLQQLIPDYIFGYEHDTLEGVVGKLLQERGKTLSIAESCTGGNISHLITSIAGSSAYFKGGFVAYSNEMKMNQLGVSEHTLNNFGAVSLETVKEMAESTRQILQTDYSLAISGIAGPSGETKDKPLGTTWIAIASEKETLCKQFLFGDNRPRNISRSSYAALNLLRLQILK